MPNLVRKLLIFAAVDGLILQPAPPKNHKPATDQAIKITYQTNGIGPLLNDRRKEDTAQQSLEAHGIIGLLKVSSSSFLISISRREQVALIRGKPVYSISEVALIPLSSQEDAQQAITKARDSQQRHSATKDDFLSESSDDDDSITLPDDASVPDPDPKPVTKIKDKATSVASDVIAKKGLYGRFADSWFSKKGWTAEQRRKQGLSSEDDVQRVKSTAKDPAATQDEESSEGQTAPVDATDVGVKSKEEQVVPVEVADVVDSSTVPQIPLLPKILTTTKIFFGSRNFFFSYDYDLSRSAANQPSPSSSQNLHRTFDTLFYWNKYLTKSFLEAGQEAFTLPLIQGFVGQREFTVDTSPSTRKITEVKTDVQDFAGADDEESDQRKPPESSRATDSAESKTFLLTLISRRMNTRPGLRYLRRGADEEGNVANSVETEQLLSSPSWGEESDKLYSYVQYRGSMPVFFSQSPYSLKPIPVFRGSPEENLAALKLHFQKLIDRYGKVQVVSLVEKKGNEGSVGRIFEQATEKMNANTNVKSPNVGFEWFDFHSVCKGMKFENVSILFDTLKDPLTSYGWTEVIEGKSMKSQAGVLRTNCMDCLDRTNVVQSNSGRIVLEKQLADQDITLDFQKDLSTSWFNTLWADNGDAISRQYAGTAALKGDFTRTRKRNISGALNDFGLTLSRYYNNIVNDYFTQALIDFVLGRADETIFADFEADMKSQDYAIDLRKVRQNAIETCSTICIEESSEHLVSGWVLKTPRVSGTLKSMPFEECVLLLTEEALYFCRMDWTIEKVKSFEKIELDSIDTISRGAYITSTLASRDMDETKNVGFVLKWSTNRKDLVRINTRSFTSEGDNLGGARATDRKDSDSNTAEEKYLAFKALPPRSSYIEANASDNAPSEVALIKEISSHIARLANTRRSGTMAREPVAEGSDELLEVQEEDVISLAEAKRSTGYLETVSHALKKLVWAS